jgi:eukaryotic translation initiation factor 2C
MRRAWRSGDGGTVLLQKCATDCHINDISNSTLLEYNVRLRYPADLPVVDLGNAKKSVWVPAELCDIVAGQPLGELSDGETAQMIIYACNPPRVNAETIVNKGFPTLGLNPVASPIDGFDISIDPEMAVIPARELPPPRLSYKVGRANVSNGSWNILDVKFHRGAIVTSWWVLVVQDRFAKIEGPHDPKLGALVGRFNEKCKNSGLVMPDGRPLLLRVVLLPDSHPKRANAVDNIRSTLKNKLREKGGNKPSFVLVLLENRDKYIYPGLKVNFACPAMNDH